MLVLLLLVNFRVLVLGLMDELAFVIEIVHRYWLYLVGLCALSNLSTFHVIV